VTLLLNHELVSRVKLYLVSVFPDIIKDCPKMRNLPKIFLRSFDQRARGRGFESAGCGLSCSNRGPVALCTLGL